MRCLPCCWCSHWESWGAHPYATAGAGIFRQRVRIPRGFLEARSRLRSHFYWLALRRAPYLLRPIVSDPLRGQEFRRCFRKSTILGSSDFCFGRTPAVGQTQFRRTLWKRGHRISGTRRCDQEAGFASVAVLSSRSHRTNTAIFPSSTPSSSIRLQIADLTVVSSSRTIRDSTRRPTPP